ncbi:unnamed protein product [Durusdinium trenchii]|uniref:Uncharacterized protein n=1 Tax=Durusdinium trenchii TaxID=1381693 RepID=A0ABP0KPF6_9DINO
MSAIELSDAQMLTAAKVLVKSLPETALEDLSEKLKDLVKSFSGCTAEAAAIVLRALHGRQRQSWQLPAARRLLSTSEDTEVPEWLLQHAVLWWPELQQVPGGSKKLQDFVEKVQKSYRASCSPRDLLAQKLLLSMEDTDDGQRPQRPWSFRSWAQNLKPWIASWEWDLDQRRLRATTDHFRFNRLAEGDASPYSDAWNQTLDKAAESDSYDIAYLLPFLAGQLRLTYQESHGVASQTLGATLNAVMCGGTLEILLLSTACSNGMLRACAFEALSIVLAMSYFWNVTSFEKDEVNKRLPFRELPELVRLLCFVRDGIEAPEDGFPPTLPRLAASFFCSVRANSDSAPAHALSNVGKVSLWETDGRFPGELVRSGFCRFAACFCSPR